MSRLSVLKLALFAFGFALSVMPLFGHHGDGRVPRSGRNGLSLTVQSLRFLWRNPHSSLYSRRADDAGKTVQLLSRTCLVARASCDQTGCYASGQ